MGPTEATSNVQVDVADTVGCGDSFTAAAALGWLAAVQLRTLLTLCNAVGAATATSVGAGRQVCPLLGRRVCRRVCIKALAAARDPVHAFCGRRTITTADCGCAEAARVG